MVTRQITLRDPQKTKVVTPITLKLNISKTMQDRQLVQTDHIQETIYDETYGHVGDDVTSHKW